MTRSKTTKDNNKWMPIGEAASYLGVSKDTLRRWEHKNRLKASRSPTNRRFYTKEDLNQAMKGNIQVNKTPQPTQIKSDPKVVKVRIGSKDTQVNEAISTKKKKIKKRVIIVFVGLLSLVITFAGILLFLFFV